VLKVSGFHQEVFEFLFFNGRHRYLSIFIALGLIALLFIFGEIRLFEAGVWVKKGVSPPWEGGGVMGGTLGGDLVAVPPKRLHRALRASDGFSQAGSRGS
jgi:hypothetical protein